MDMQQYAKFYWMLASVLGLEFPAVQKYSVWNIKISIYKILPIWVIGGSLSKPVLKKAK